MNEDFFSYKCGSGEVSIHHLINTSDYDFQTLVQCAEFFARTFGDTVMLPPRMTRPKQFEYDTIYGALKDTSFYGKCPDICRNGRWYEHEGFITDNPHRAFNSMMNRGLKQSNRLIIEHPDLSIATMKRSIEHRLQIGQDILEVWIRNFDGTLTPLYIKSEE